ncbi:MAG: hypothetical protein EKK51_03255 [Mycolicibacterium sp.]|uniref:hypothetical protein n=1 Tax=Mycolicibacterium sp. TaxID=2320850 RepID=UPI000FABDBEB|nr:hypothetical protein [Mycolicibacterium sp.]RUP34244.1 MAG: hypothetical protein EKK51_03255 [Mycolicibacterium sp.]
MTYPDPRYPQQQPQPGPYPQGHPVPQHNPAPQGYGYPPPGHPNPQQPYAPSPYPYAQPGYQQPQTERQSNGNSAGWRAASVAMSTLFRGTYRLGGDARSRVVTALMCLGIGLVALVIVVLAGMYLR